MKYGRIDKVQVSFSEKKKNLEICYYVNVDDKTIIMLYYYYICIINND